MESGDTVSKLLLVDDEDFNLKALKVMLEHHVQLCPFTPMEFATNGVEAMQKVMADVAANGNKSTGFKVILMDCEMPVLDGCTATKNIRQFLKGAGID